MHTDEYHYFEITGNDIPSALASLGLTNTTEVNGSYRFKGEQNIDGLKTTFGGFVGLDESQKIAFLRDAGMPDENQAQYIEKLDGGDSAKQDYWNHYFNHKIFLFECIEVASDINSASVTLTDSDRIISTNTEGNIAEYVGDDLILHEGHISDGSEHMIARSISYAEDFSMMTFRDFHLSAFRSFITDQSEHDELTQTMLWIVTGKHVLRSITNMSFV